MKAEFERAMRRLRELQEDAVLHLRRTADATHEQVTPLVEKAEDASKKAAQRAVDEAKRAVKFPL